MPQRLDYKAAAPAVFRAISQFERPINAYDLDPILRNLVAMRASQINGCAFCLSYRARDARALASVPINPDYSLTVTTPGATTAAGRTLGRTPLPLLANRRGRRARADPRSAPTRRRPS